MKIIFATGNKNKLEEAMKILGERYELISPEQLGITEDIPETSDTLIGNAIQKAEYIWNKTGLPCFSDDTGLEVDYLNGSPGVYSARYAGANKSASDNINKLLAELIDVPSEKRQARFNCAIALIINGELFTFEGSVEGRITEEPMGIGGFGYDPIFIADGYDKSFSQIDPQVKNSISHRKRALEKLSNFLKNKS